MKVVQCWDDGISADIPLIEILRRHKATATFNLNAGLHEAERSNGWIFKETEVVRLARSELLDVYDGFTIANHGLVHKHLNQISADEARHEVRENRKQLQDIFNQPIEGFAYAFGSYDQTAMDIIAEEGHCYARTCKNVDMVFPVEDPMAFHSNCHFLSPEFWQRYEHVKKTDPTKGVFYFWGHSYEMINDQMWTDFEANIKRISDDPDAEWCELVDLFK